MRHLVAFVLIVVCISSALHGKELDIALQRGATAEAQTREQLQRILKTYDLSRWIFTESIRIDETAIPFSHPTLTLSTRHLKDDELLLSTFVHEQAHWFLAERADDAGAAIQELRKMFPKVPSGPPEGARNEYST
jgi:hypothetical protein